MPNTLWPDGLTRAQGMWTAAGTGGWLYHSGLQRRETAELGLMER